MLLAYERNVKKWVLRKLMKTNRNCCSAQRKHSGSLKFTMSPPHSCLILVMGHLIFIFLARAVLIEGGLHIERPVICKTRLYCIKGMFCSNWFQHITCLDINEMVVAQVLESLWSTNSYSFWARQDLQLFPSSFIPKCCSWPPSVTPFAHADPFMYWFPTNVRFAPSPHCSY